MFKHNVALRQQRVAKRRTQSKRKRKRDTDAFAIQYTQILYGIAQRRPAHCQSEGDTRGARPTASAKSEKHAQTHEKIFKKIFEPSFPALKNAIDNDNKKFFKNFNFFQIRVVTVNERENFSQS